MAFDSSNLVLHIKRLVFSSVSLGYQYSCDYPIVLGAGVLLLFLHGLCPSLFNFLVSSSPVFVLTTLLLGALLSYGEPTVPVTVENQVNQHTLALKSEISITDRSVDEVENVVVKEHLENTAGSDEIFIRERASDDMHGIHCEEENAVYMAVDTIHSEEVYAEDRTSHYNLHSTQLGCKSITSDGIYRVPYIEPSSFAKNSVPMEREEHDGENNKKIELQDFESLLKDFESISPDGGKNNVQNQYQLGEFMSSCWQPITSQNPCCDSESDGSSPDASMTDIIPMLEELHPLIDLGTGLPSFASRDNLNSSSDDNEDDLEEEDEEEDEDISSDEDEGAEGNKDDGNNWKDVINVNSLDVENNSELESMMDLQRAKNILKFELDKKLMDLQAADAIQKMEEASRFCVQVPSISTPRPIIELPDIPGSAPSTLLPRKNIFDFPFDRIVDHDSQLIETWTPRSHFSVSQHKRHMNLYGRHSTNMHHNRLNFEKGAISGNNADDNHLQEGNNGKLFGSLEAHMGEEIKILGSAFSDGGILEVNCGMDNGNKNTDFSDDICSSPGQKSMNGTFEAKDPVHSDNSEPHIVEADSIGEVNSLFKCRMEEVLVQSISESSIGQPLTVKLEDESSDPLSSYYGVHVVEDLDSQFVQLNEEALACADSNSTCHYKAIEEKLREALPAENGDFSELPNEDRSTELLTSEDQQAADSSEVPVIEASTEDNCSFIQQYCEESHKKDDLELEPPVQGIQNTTTDQFSSDSEQTRSFSELHVLEASSVDDITAEFKKLRGELKIHSASEPTINFGHSSDSDLRVVEEGSTEEEPCLVKELSRESQMEVVSDSALSEQTTVNLEGKPNEPLPTDAGLGVVQASSVQVLD